MKTCEALVSLKDLQNKFGFTTDHVVAAAKGQVQRNAQAA